MNIRRMLLSIIAILFGAFMIVYGDKDDSPGAQFLGLVVAVIGIIGVAKSKKRLPNPDSNIL